MKHILAFCIEAKIKLMLEQNPHNSHIFSHTQQSRMHFNAFRSDFRHSRHFCDFRNVYEQGVHELEFSPN